MQKSFQNKNRKDCLSTRYGTMLSNYYQAHQALYQDDYYPLPKKKSPKQKSSSKNIYDETRSDHHGVHTQPTSYSSKRKMANSDQYRC